MKRILFTLVVIVLASVQVFTQGWREHEMEVEVSVATEAEAQILHDLKFNGDIYPGYAVLYVVPEELDRIAAAGLDYEITIKDLNEHFAGFWLSEDAYHSYAEIIALADSLATHFPWICEKHLYGTSIQGRQLAALKISDNVSVDENEPEIMFDGGIHGDEIGCSENVIRFARELCLEYGNNATITTLVDTREIWLYLMVNPDGRVNMSRYNANGVDLNRDAGYMWDAWGGSPGAFSQIESQALRECMYSNQFVIHTAYHSGTEYVSYPWSYRPDQTPEHAHIDFLAALYSSSSGYSGLTYGQGFNGMYAINGSTKDCNYGIMGSVSWSMEISYSKQPPASQIMMYYNYNKPAMLTMIEYSGYGIEGVVTDTTTGQPVSAMVFVNNGYPTYTDPVVGDYHKFLVPGTYDITVKANGYQTKTITGVTVTSMNATVVDVELQPKTGWHVYKFSMSQIPDNNYADEGYTPAALGPPDNINYSIGKNGWCILDMENSIPDTPGGDFMVYEGDTSPEGFTCMVSDDMDGPWISLGTGSGTTEFDLLNGNVAQARFIKLIDDGDGTAVSADAGFDLDAIKVYEPVPGPYLIIHETIIDDVAGGNGNGMLDPGETVDLVITLKNNGDQAALGTTGGLNVCSPYITLIDPNAVFGDIQPGGTGTGTYTIGVDPATPIGHVACLSQYVTANGGAYSNYYELYFTVGLVVENFETGNFNAYPWQFSGSSPWVITTSAPYEGTYCSKSGTISHNQTSTMFLMLNVAAPGNISFARKVSSEPSYDFLKFYIDGILQDQWSGAVAWGEVSYPVSAGNHTFTWEYYKDQNTSNGSDCAWVDYIIFPGLAPPAPSIDVTPLSMDFGQVFVGDQLTKQLSITNSGTAELTGDVTTPTGYTVGSAKNTVTFTLQPGQAANYDVTFAPTATQTYNGDIVITHNAGGGDVIVPVTGEGINGFTLPYIQDFENSGNLPYAWINANYDDIDWIVNSGGTPSSGTGPSGDHTTGSGYYMYIEASNPNYPDKEACLETPLFDLAGMNTAEMKFWYHMYGSGMGSLHVDIYSGGTWFNDVMPAISGNQNNVWHEMTIDLASYIGQGIKIRFRGITGSSYTSDIAIDDFWIGGEAGTPQIGVAPVSIDLNLPPETTQQELINISNGGDGSLTYTSSVNYISGSGWLNIIANGAATVPAGSSIDMTAEVSTVGMLPGVYNAEIILDCNDPVNPSVTVPVNLVISGAAILDLKAFLEGPFGSGQMYAFLNVYGYLPLSQPYNTAPWNYQGTESVASLPGSDIVDWVLVELRETTGDASTAVSDSAIARQAAFIMRNGDIVGMDGISNLMFSLDVTGNLYVVIYHRNHLGIMSKYALVQTGGIYTYDFSTAMDMVYGDYNAHKEIEPGVWGMIGGDGWPDGQVSMSDKIDVWLQQSGTSGYQQGDFDLNGQVSNQDKVDIWGANAGRGCQVPE